MNENDNLKLCLASFDIEDFPSIANALASADAGGWALIAKYGDHPHPGPPPGQPNAGKPLLQRFDRAAADNIVAAYNSTWGRVKRAITGLPIFNGHPDVPGFEKIFPDTEVKGTWAKLEAREDGLYGQPVLTPNGADLVTGGRDRLSPYWWCKPLAALTADGRPIVSPFRLLSVGLVDKGNIPGPSLMNSATATQTHDNPMNKERDLLIQILAALGTNVTAQAGDTELANAVQTCIGDLQKKTADAAKAAPAAAANAALLAVLANAKLDDKAKLETALTELAASKTAIATANSAVTTATATATTLTAERDTARTALANAEAATKAERKAHATRFANAAMTAGKIRAADVPVVIERLCNAADLKTFDADTKTVAEGKPLLSTEGKALTALGNQKVETTPTPNRSAKIQDLVAARMKEKEGEDYTTAYANVATDPANAAIFEGMKEPDLPYKKEKGGKK
jgi:hypothetical protein